MRNCLYSRVSYGHAEVVIDISEMHLQIPSAFLLFAFILNISYCASLVSRVFFLFLTMVFSIILRVQVLNIIIFGSEEFKIITRGKRFRRSPGKKIGQQSLVALQVYNLFE